MKAVLAVTCLVNCFVVIGSWDDSQCDCGCKCAPKIKVYMAGGKHGDKYKSKYAPKTTSKPKEEDFCPKYYHEVYKMCIDLYKSPKEGDEADDACMKYAYGGHAIGFKNKLQVKWVADALHKAHPDIECVWTGGKENGTHLVWGASGMIFDSADFSWVDEPQTGDCIKIDLEKRKLSGESCNTTYPVLCQKYPTEYENMPKYEG